MKRGLELIVVVLSLGYTIGCKSLTRDFTTLVYERSIAPGGEILHERYVLSGKGRTAQEEVKETFKRIYEDSSKRQEKGLFYRIPRHGERKVLDGI